jgi:hypothetical protein
MESETLVFQHTDSSKKGGKRGERGASQGHKIEAPHYSDGETRIQVSRRPEDIRN